MANEIAKRDENREPVETGVTDDAAKEIRQQLVDPDTGAFLAAPRTRKDTPETFEDTAFVSGDSPAVLDINTALGRNGTEFTVINDGIGNFTVSLSSDGVAFGDEHTVKNGETYELVNISIDSIRITHIADSAYRVITL